MVSVEEIKFKAWHKATKRMFFVQRIEFDLYTGPTTIVLTKPLDPFAEEEVALPEEVDLLLFTGAKDKNGDDVYKGDIIEKGVIVNNLCIKYGDLATGLQAVKDGREFVAFPLNGGR